MDSPIVVGPFAQGFLATCPACEPEPVERRFVGFGTTREEAVQRVREHLERYPHEWSAALIDQRGVADVSAAVEEALARAEGLELGSTVE